MVSRAWLDKTKVNNTPVKIGAKNHNKEEKMQKQKARKEGLSFKEMSYARGGYYIAGITKQSKKGYEDSLPKKPKK